MNFRIYITFFFSFLVESLSTKKYFQVKEFESQIENAPSIKELHLIKGEIRESSGFFLALTMCFIWLSVFSFALAFFFFTFGFILIALNIAGFVYFLQQWRYINGFFDLCLFKMNQLEQQ